MKQHVPMQHKALTVGFKMYLPVLLLACCCVQWRIGTTGIPDDRPPPPQVPRRERLSLKWPMTGYSETLGMNNEPATQLEGDLGADGRKFYQNKLALMFYARRAQFFLCTALSYNDDQDCPASSIRSDRLFLLPRRSLGYTSAMRERMRRCNKVRLRLPP